MAAVCGSATCCSLKNCVCLKAVRAHAAQLSFLFHTGEWIKVKVRVTHKLQKASTVHHMCSMEKCIVLYRAVSTAINLQYVWR